MAVQRTWAGWVTRLGIAAVLAAALAGCSRQDGEKPVVPSQPPAHPAAGQAVRTGSREHQPFALVAVSDVPDQYLPETTLTGKSVGKLYEEAVRRWDETVFVTPTGQRLRYTARVETDLGQIEIELWPELAPNHVRSFVTLARCGYFDGLVFERTISEQSEDNPADKVELIEGGCPSGTGNVGYGSIGYWLKPEFSAAVTHEAGSVGACRGEEPDSAACRFYITLGKMPVMDGERTIFGKVSRGLDVVRRILTQPVSNSPEYPLGDRPEKPVVMRKVSIQVQPATAGSKTGP